jgi:hypothetical protein
LAGTACANYLTPVVMSILPQGVQTNGKYAVAFVMGFMGLKGLELILEKWFNKNIKDVEKTAVIKPKSRRKKIKKG